MTKVRKQIKNGSFLGACKILRLLGRGSVGETYEAQDVLLNRHAVVKVVSPFITDSGEITKRFTSVGQTLARISHPNVATVYSLKEIDRIHFIIMEFVEGRSLKDLIKNESSLEPVQAVQIFSQVFEGVKCLHEAGILHQDLKPKNIIVRQDGFVKVVDFGIGRIDGQEIVSTVYYVAPEVIDGQAGSVQSDIWSLGVCLYEAVTGIKPFQSEDWGEVVAKIATEAMVFPEELKDKIPVSLQEIIQKMCAKDPADRYATIFDLQQDLKSANLGVSPGATIDMETRAFKTSSGPHVGSGSQFENVVLTDEEMLPKPKRKGKMLAGLVAAIALVGWIYHSYSKLQSSAETDEAGLHSTHMIFPSEGQQVRLAEGENINFKSSLKPHVGVYLEVARDRVFREIVFKEPFRTSPYTPTKLIREGRYFWRLVDPSETPAKILTEPTSFIVVNESAPRPMYPGPQFVLTDGKPVQFYWLNKFAVDTYRFQISPEPSFEHLVSDVVVDGIQTEPISLPQGQFYWRVRAEDHHSVTSEWSTPRTIVIPSDLGRVPRQNTLALAKHPEMAPAKPETPPVRPAATPVAIATPTPPPAPVAPVVEPARAQAHHPSRKIKPRAIAHAPKAVVPKRVAHRAPVHAPTRKPAAVKPARSAPEVAPASVAQPEGIPGPKLKLPPDRVSIVSLNGAQDPILFRWESRGDDAIYRLQLASDVGFRHIVLNVLVRQNQYVVTKTLPLGRIFWRVRSDDGTKSNWSAISTFEISK
jgi:serine/threonine-protein kinase